MEQKNYNGEGSIIKKNFSGENQTEIMCEYTLPDYFPDIKRVLNVFSSIRPTSVYINGENGSGTIPAGTKVVVAFSFEPHVETNERGTIDFYRDGKLLFSIDVVAEY